MNTREKTAALVRDQDRYKDLERRLLETEQCLAAAEIQIELLEAINGKWQAATLDQLRRILSVLEETTPGGGDAANREVNNDPEIAK